MIWHLTYQTCAWLSSDAKLDMVIVKIKQFKQKYVAWVRSPNTSRNSTWRRRDVYIVQAKHPWWHHAVLAGLQPSKEMIYNKQLMSWVMSDVMGFLLFHFYFCGKRVVWIILGSFLSNVSRPDVRNQLACISLLKVYTEWFLASPIHSGTFENEMHRRHPYLQQIAQSTRHLFQRCDSADKEVRKDPIRKPLAD